MLHTVLLCGFICFFIPVSGVRIVNVAKAQLRIMPLSATLKHKQSMIVVSHKSCSISNLTTGEFYNFYDLTEKTTIIITPKTSLRYEDTH